MGSLATYFDVSGNAEDSANAYAVAGFGSSDSKWRAFEQAWPAVLQRAGIPALHMTDVANKKKRGFRHITTQIYGELMLSLYQLLQEHAWISIVRVIEGLDLIALASAGKEPLAIAGCSAIEAAAKWNDRRNRRKRRADSLEVIFHHGESGRGTLLKSISPSFPVPSFRAHTEALPLQAADWLAWEMARLNLLHRKHRGHGGQKIVAVRGTVAAAIRHFPRDWKYYHDGDWIDIVGSKRIDLSKGNDSVPT
ncbi:MAG: hypothetical protein ACREM1_05400 [Longimicrobiales bacterium]